jgi:hypothetical protein
VTPETQHKPAGETSNCGVEDIVNGHHAKLMAAGVLALCVLHGIATAGDAKKDKASQLMDNLLRPAGVVKTAGGSSQRTLPGPGSIENPAVPLATFQGDPPKPKAEFPGKVTPKPLAEDLPFLKKKIEPARPRGIKLPPGTLIRLEGIDVNQPVPLPILGQLQKDRAPLADPTLDASLAAALKQPIPERVTPAPFVRMNLPDPFENVATVRLRTPPPEEPNPVTGQPRAPKK